MTFKVDDRVLETSTTTGTGAYALAGASTGFQSFAFLSSGDTTWYFASDGTNWETGIGTYSTGPATLTRTTVIASSNSDAAVDWAAGTREIRCGLPASFAVPRRKAKSVAGNSNVTLTQDEQRCAILELTGALTGNIDVIVDATPWHWPIVYNNTTGAHTLTFKVSGQTGIVVPQKRAMSLHCNGTDIIRPGDEARVEARNSNTILGVADHGKTIRFTGSFTQTLTAAATLGDGWYVDFKVAAGSVVVLDPNSSETVDGATTMTLRGGASGRIRCDSAGFYIVGRNSAGRQPIWIPRAAWVQRTSNGPSIGSSELSSNKVMVETLDFDGTAAEYAQAQIAMPDAWDEGTVTFKPYWTGAAGAGGVTWRLSGVALSDDDAMDAAQGTAQKSDDTFITANDLHIGPESSAITIAGTPAAGDLVIFEVSRNPADAADTKAEDGKLIGVMLYINVNQPTEDG